MTTNYDKMTLKALAKKVIEDFREQDFSEDAFQAFYAKLVAKAEKNDDCRWAKLDSADDTVGKWYWLNFHHDKYDDMYIDNEVYASSFDNLYVDLATHIEHVRNDYVNDVAVEEDDYEYLRFPITKDEIKFGDDDWYFGSDDFSFEDFNEECMMANNAVYRIMAWCAKHPGKFVVCGYED